MSVRVDTSSLIAGACVVGHRGLGLLGSVIRATTATGTHGPGYLYNDLTGADDLKEICGLIVTPPSAGTFFAFEDGSFILTGAPDDSYSFTYRLFADGADLGTATGSITVGAAADIAVTAAIIGTISGSMAASADVSDPAPGGAAAVSAAILGTITGAMAAQVGQSSTISGTISGVVSAQVSVFGLSPDTVVLSSHIMRRVYVGEAGREVILECGQELVDVTAMSINVRKPGGSVEAWDAVASGASAMKFVTGPSSFDESGVWLLQAAVTTSEGTLLGETTHLQVHSPFS